MKLFWSLFITSGICALLSGCGSVSGELDSSSSESVGVFRDAETQAALSGSQVTQFAPHRMQQCSARRVSGLACQNLLIETKPVRIGVVSIYYVPDFSWNLTTRVPTSVKAMLDVIAAAEGTSDTRKCNDLGGYTVGFSFTCLQSLLQHPAIARSSGGYTSDATGRYQFLSTTWKIAINVMNPVLATLAKLSGMDQWLPFGPKAQDTAAAVLIKHKQAASGAWQTLSNLQPAADGSWTGAHFKKFQDVLNGLAPEWASLPTKQGRSFYGQPVHAANDLWKVFQAAHAIYSAREGTSISSEDVGSTGEPIASAGVASSPQISLQ